VHRTALESLLTRLEAYLARYVTMLLGRSTRAAGHEDNAHGEGAGQEGRREDEGPSVGITWARQAPAATDPVSIQEASWHAQ